MTRSPSAKVVISERVLADLFGEAEAQMPRETGGVLIGHWESPTVVYVRDAIGPGPRARHTRTSFRPDYDFQEAEIARIYEESGRVTTYLGDWHSHPGGIAALSERDEATLRRICGEPQARAEKALMAILTDPAGWEFTAWTGTLHGRIWKRLRVSPASVMVTNEDLRT
jgi:integrative and conjugative element protein (TIGR02256 family)